MEIAVRTDASPEIGAGHVMRCLTLADEVRSRGTKVTFITRASAGQMLLDMIRAKGHDLHILGGPVHGNNSDIGKSGSAHAQWLPVPWEADADETLEVLAAIGGVNWLVVDHYALDARWERRMRPQTAKILAIDDLADRPHDCDLLLDQNLGRKSIDYAGLVPDSARLLIGPEYALLRPEFRDARVRALARRQDGGPVRRILVSFGGSDTQGLTGMALKAIEASGLDVLVDVAAGNSDPEALGLAEIARRMPQDVTFHGFDANMAELMCEADLAIGAAGSSSWERCCLGLPTLAISIAENQNPIVRELEHRGAIVGVGPPDNSLSRRITQILVSLDHSARARMSGTASAIIDGLGSVRINTEFADIGYTKLGECVRLRIATTEDSELVHRWQSIPGVRRHSRNPQTPTWIEHKMWFAEKLDDLNGILAIIEVEGTPSGLVRLDSRDAGEFEVSVLVPPERQGAGIASQALRHIGEMYECADLWAYVKKGNTASLALFDRCDYEPVGDDWYVRRASTKERSNT